MRLRSCILPLLLSTLVLTSCHKQMQTEPGHEDRSQVKFLVERFVDDMTTTGERNLDVYSVPFWADGHWILSMEQLAKEIPKGGNQEFPGLKSLNLRLYPVEHLDVLFSSAWQRLQESEIPEHALDEVYATAIVIEIEGAGRTEQGWLLMRKMDGMWKVAGVVER